MPLVKHLSSCDLKLFFEKAGPQAQRHVGRRLQEIVLLAQLSFGSADSHRTLLYDLRHKGMGDDIGKESKNEQAEDFEDLLDGASTSYINSKATTAIL